MKTFKNITTIIIASLFLFTLPCKADDFLKTIKTRMKLNITHSIYSAIIADHFEEKFEVYDPIILADRIFFLTFLNEWKYKIETGEYESTKDIFSSLLKNRTYITRFYKLWYEIHQPENNIESLHNKNWWDLTSIGAVYQLETKFSDLEQYANSILGFISSNIITEKQNYDLALLFFDAFKSSKIESIRGRAEGFNKNIKFRKNWEKISLGFDITGIVGGLAKITKLPGLIKKLFSQKISSKRKVKPINFGRLAKNAKRIGRDKLRKYNPFSSMPRLLTASTAIHALGGVTAWSIVEQKKNSKKAEPILTKKQTKIMQDMKSKKNEYFQLENLVVDFESFYFLLLENFPAMMNPSYRDFPISYLPKTEDWIVSEAIGFIKGTNKDYPNFAEVIIQAEKHMQVDERNYSDSLAIEIISNTYKYYEKEVFKIFSEYAPAEAIEKVRELVINGHLESYIRDNPSLTSLFIDWGGNCVSQTALLTSLLYPYQDRLPEGQKLGIYLSKSHIETVLYNDSIFDMLVEGSRYSTDNMALFKPEYLMLLIARNFKKMNSFNTTELIALNNTGNKIKQKKPSNGLTNPNFSMLTGRQKGALDTSLLSDLIALGVDISRPAPRNIPASATISYQKIDKQYIKNKYDDDSFFNGMTSKRDTSHLKVNHLVRKGAKKKKTTLKFEIERYTAQHTLDFFEITENSSEKMRIRVSDDILASRLLLAKMKRNNKKEAIFKTLIEYLFSKENHLAGENGLMAQLSNADIDSHFNSCTKDNCELINLDDHFQKVEFFILDLHELINQYFFSRQNKIENRNSDTVVENYLRMLANLAEKTKIKIAEIIYKRKEFFDQYTQNPKSFFTYFNELDRTKRKYFYFHMMQKISNLNVISPVDQALFNDLPNSFVQSLGLYLYRLEKIKIVGGENVATITINLPSMSARAARHFGSEQFSVHDKEIEGSEIKTSHNPSEKDASEQLTTETLTLKSDVLLESTFLFGLGHHLWSSEVLDSLMSKNFSKYNMEIQEIEYRLREGLNYGYDSSAIPILKKIDDYLPN